MNVTNKYDYIEIQCILHQQCNLQCKFCFETDNGIRKPTTINIDYIRNLPDEIMKAINPIIKDNDINILEISTMGGELFSDNISDEVFDVYREFAYNLKQMMNTSYPRIKCEFKVLSNGVFTKHERVEKLLKEFNFRLVLSYDPCDRFSNDHQKQMWLDTYRYFKEMNIEVWVANVLTKPNINAYIAGDEIFNSIPNGSYIENNIYIPRLDYHDYLPSDDDIYNFYKWCIDNDKFNINLINIMMKTYHDEMRIPSCGETRYDFIFSEEFISKYGIPYINKCTEESPICKEEYYGQYINDIKDVNDCSRYKHHLAKNKRGCLYCEYHGKCAEPCWTQVIFKDYKITECPIKRVYQYIEDNPSIMDKYLQWRDKYGDKC